MNVADAMNAALRALGEIATLAEGSTTIDAEDALDEIHDKAVDVLDDLARAGYRAP